ncbi:MAG: ABC transporter substrate-binding protein [Actinomycetota bacterium]
MKNRQATRAIAIAVMLSAAAVACGQYPNTHELAFRDGEGSGTLGGSPDQPGQDSFGTDSLGPTVGADGTQTGGGTTTGGSTGAGTSGNAGSLTGHTTTGVTATSITLGIHAPITGAAPVTDESFEEGKDLYWRYGNDGKAFSIYGRQVRVIVEDDHYNPTFATQVCKEMVEEDRAFLLIGGAGTDQIVACAKYAETQPGPVPYLSAGVTQEPLEGRPHYFALSMSYPQQIPLLVEYIKKNYTSNASRVAAVITNTPNFDDALAAWNKAFPGTDVYRPDKNDSATTYGQDLCRGAVDRYDVVFPLTAPLFWLQMAGQATCQPRWAGVGITMGIDPVASAVCDLGYTTDSAHFFSPAAAFTDVGAKNQQFMRAARAKGVDPDDIMWLLWGTSAGLHQLFLKAGSDLSRERFIQSTSNASVNGQGVFPSLRYTPSDHFGASRLNVLRLVCPVSEDGHWLTEAQNVSGF